MPEIDGNPNIAEAGRATRFVASTRRLKGREKPSAQEKVFEEREEKLRLFVKEHMLEIILQDDKQLNRFFKFLIGGEALNGGKSRKPEHWGGR